MPYVYRYIDKLDDIIKYVGIVVSQKLRDRVRQHKYQDIWCTSSDFKIQYFEVKTRCDAEMWEAHLIAEYKTHRYFNKAKSSWGLSSYLDSATIKWEDFDNATKNKQVDKKKVSTILMPQKTTENIYYIQSVNVEYNIFDKISVVVDYPSCYVENIYIEYLENALYATITNPLEPKRKKKDKEYRLKNKDRNKILVDFKIYTLLKDYSFIDDSGKVGGVDFKIDIYNPNFRGNYSMGIVFGYFDESNKESAIVNIRKLEEILYSILY